VSRSWSQRSSRSFLRAEIPRSSQQFRSIQEHL
jgi:hypothetical protein